MKTPNVSKLLRTARVFTTKHGPEILTGIGLAGMASTVALAVTATPKAVKLIDEAKKEEKKDKLTVVETVKVAWKPYIPAVVSGVMSTACIIGARSVSARRIAALETAYQLSTTALSEYKDKVVEVVGEKKEQAIRDEVIKDKVEKNPPNNNTVIVTGGGKTLFYDEFSDRYFMSDIDKIKRVINELNRRMTYGSEPYLSLNEFYDEIELPHVGMGNTLGWRPDIGLIDVRFGSMLTDKDEPCVTLEHLMPPQYGFDTTY